MQIILHKNSVIMYIQCNICIKLHYFPNFLKKKDSYMEVIPSLPQVSPCVFSSKLTKVYHKVMRIASTKLKTLRNLSDASMTLSSYVRSDLDHVCIFSSSHFPFHVCDFSFKLNYVLRCPFLEFSCTRLYKAVPVVERYCPCIFLKCPK